MPFRELNTLEPNLVKRGFPLGSFSIPTDRLITILVFSAVAILSFFKIGDPDFFWHLANGKAMVEQGRIINQEIFSYTKEGTPFSNRAWLAQIIFYSIFRAAGPFGIVMFKTLIVLMIAYFSYRTARLNGADTIWACALMAAAVFIGITRYRERPEIFSLLLFTFLGMIISGYVAGRASQKSLYTIPVILVVWDFLHGAVFGIVFLLSFTFGMTGQYLLHVVSSNPSEETVNDSKTRAKHLWILSSISLLCMLINPYGLRTYDFFVEFLQTNPMLATIIEDTSPSFVMFLDFWILLMITVILSLVFIRKIDLTYVIIFMPFAYLSIHYLRVRPFFSLAAIPALASYSRHIMATTEALSRHSLKKLIKLIPYAMSMAFLIYTVQVKFVEKNHPLSFGYEINELFIPLGATKFISKSGLKGNMFNPGHFGGCLAYFLYPERKIFLYNHHMMFREFPLILSNPDFIERYKIEYAVLDRNTGGDPVSHLFTTGRWALLYFDELSLVVARRNGVNEPIIRQHGLM